MGGSAPVHVTRKLPHWDDLDSIEQILIGVASQELTLEHASASWSQRPRGRPEIERTRSAAARLYQRGLIGFYRVDDGYPDLIAGQLDLVLRGDRYWDCGDAEARRFGLFLTPAGEEVVLAP